MRTGEASGLNTTATASQHSPWHSPVPYLFGGLAAMLGLIAFALLILACSYWKLSGYWESGENGERDLENGDEKTVDAVKIPQTFEAKVVVIMAGDEKPTYLATPISSTAVSFGDNTEGNEKEEHQKKEVENQKNHSQDQNQENHSQDQNQDQQVVDQEGHPSQDQNHNQ